MVCLFQNVEAFYFTDREERIPHHTSTVNTPRMKMQKTQIHDSTKQELQNASFQEREILKLTVGHSFRIYIAKRRMIKWNLHQVSFYQCSRLKVNLRLLKRFKKFYKNVIILSLNLHSLKGFSCILHINFIVISKVQE